MTEQQQALEQMLAILMQQRDGDTAYETLANLNYNVFVRCGWESIWPVFAARVGDAMEARHLMDEPAGNA